MSDSRIEWTDVTWNPTTGCDKVSPGCGMPRPSSNDEETGQTGGCYAMALAKRLKAMGQEKYQKDGDPRTSGPGFGVSMHPDVLDAPLRWAKPRRVFVNSMSDLFHEKISASFIADVFAVMALTPQHTYQVLTKRHGRLRSLLNTPEFWYQVGHQARHLGYTYDSAANYFHDGRNIYDLATWTSLRHLPNVWLGVSVETQRWADIRIPALLETPAAVRFISAEPLLGPVRLGEWLGPRCLASRVQAESEFLDWVIAGGESGPGARPMHPAWARSLRDQCQTSGVAFHFKQWGEYGLLPKIGPNGAWANDPGITIANDGTVYQPGDLTYPDGPRYGEAIRARHDKAALHAMYRVGKKTAGRTLDGQTWDQYPAVTS